MGCSAPCPGIPGKHYRDWTLQSLNSYSIDAVRPIRDEIERRVRDLADDLGVTTPS
jgi:arsenate reductase (thioredoxin)